MAGRTIEDHVPVRHVWLLSAGFFCLFAAYMTSELMQTTINGSSGYVCIFVLYSCLMVSSILAPWLVHVFGSRRVLWLSSVSYVCMTASYLLVGNHFFLTASCAWVGLSAATLWNAQSCYLAECTHILAEVSSAEFTDCASKLNAMFYRVFSGAGCASNLFAAAVIYTSSGSVEPLFAVLTVVALSGTVFLSLLPEPSSLALFQLPFVGAESRAGRGSQGSGKNQETHFLGSHVSTHEQATGTEEGRAELVRVDQLCALTESAADDDTVDGGQPAERRTEPPTPWTMLKFIMTDRKVLFITPLLVATGAKQAALIGIFMQNVGMVLGAWTVALLGAGYGLGQMIAMTFWADIVQRPHVGRAGAFAFAIPVQVVWCIGVMLWCGDAGSIEDPSPASSSSAPSSAAPSSPSPPDSSTYASATLTATPRDYVTVWLLTVLLSLVDNTLTGFSRATLQALFRRQHKALSCAMSCVTLFNSLGIAVQSAISLALGGRYGVQMMMLLALWVGAGISLRHLHRNVCSLDPRDGSISNTRGSEREGGREGVAAGGRGGSDLDMPTTRCVARASQDKIGTRGDEVVVLERTVGR
jgi:hypothetical protein